MSGLETADAELAIGKLRIAQLEREAIERSGDAAKALRVQLDRYQSLVLAIAQVIWTNDPSGAMIGEQPSWAAYTGQTAAEYRRLLCLRRYPQRAAVPSHRARTVVR